MAGICIKTPERKTIVADIERRDQDKGSSIVGFILNKGQDEEVFFNDLAEDVVKRKGWPASKPLATGIYKYKLRKYEVTGWVLLHVGVETVEAYASKIQKRIRAVS